MAECLPDLGYIEKLDCQTRSALEWILEPFTHYTMGAAAFIVLISLAGVSTYVAYRRASFANKQIRHAIAIIESSEDEIEFTEKFEEISARLQSIAVLKRPWEEFQETLIPPLESVDDPSYRVYRNTKRPQEFFVPDEVLHDVRPWMDGERLIGFGLAFTFIGLIAALTKASGGFNGNEEITVALAALLSTAGAKFLASIGGLIGSISQSMLSNLFVGGSIRTLASFNDVLEQRLSFASIERISADHYGHAQRQTARLEEMGTEITLALGNEISKAMGAIPSLMGAEFSKALQPMQDSLSNVTERMSQNNTDALANMVGEFREQIQGAGEQSMQLVIDQLNGLSSTLGSTIEGLQASNDEMKSGLREAVSAITSASEQFNSSIGSSAESASNQMSQISESLGTTIEDLLRELREQQNQNSSAFENLIQQFNDTSSRATEVLETQTEESVKEMADTLNSSLGRILESASANTDAMANSVQEGLQRVSEQAQADLQELLSSISEQLKQGVAGVTDSLSEWQQSTGQVSASLSRINSELDKHSTGLLQSNERILEASSAFRGVANTVESAASPLQRISESLRATVVALESANSETLEAVSDISESLDRAVTSSARAVDELKETWNQHATHLKGADQQLEQAFNSVTVNLSASLEALQRFSTDLGSQVGEITQNFASIVEDLGDTIDELNSRRN